jgi:hypothetical protein
MMRCMPSANAKSPAGIFSALPEAFSFSVLHAFGSISVRAPSSLTSLSMKKLCLIFVICWAASCACLGKDAYQFLSEIPIGGEGGWDILTIASRVESSNAQPSTPEPHARALLLTHSSSSFIVPRNR